MRRPGLFTRVVLNAGYFAMRLAGRFGVLSLWAFMVWPGEVLAILEVYGLTSALLFEVTRYQDRRLLMRWWGGRLFGVR